MKVAFVLPGQGNSGGVRVTVIAANHLIDRGHDVRILFKNAPISIRNIYHLMRDRLIYKDPGWLAGFKGSLGGFNEITDNKFEDGEVIIAVGMWASGQLEQLNSVSNPKIQYIHGGTPWEPMLMEKALALPFPKIVVASYLKPLVESYGGGEVLGIVHNGIDTKEYFNAVGESEKNGFGTIYATHPAKDPKTILAVMEKISKVRPDIPIRVFSKDKRPRQLKKVSFCSHPSVEKARNIYSMSSVWMLASNSEGFPAPVLEAMACGCAVVATDCLGTRDMIVDGENGYLVDIGNVEQLVEKILLLYDDEKLRKRICANAEKSIKFFSWDKSIDQLEYVLEKISSSGGKVRS